VAVRICLLTTQDLDADPFPDDDWPCDPRPFFDADWHAENLTGQDGPARIRELAAEGFDLFFNLCDGAADEDRPGIEVVLTLEELGVPFTGATSNYYEPSRLAMKEACAREAIPTPAFVFAESDADVERALVELAFPMFVKHHSSYASVSLTPQSRVETPDELRRQAKLIIDRHRVALIEEFVAGAEYTVLVAENPDDANAPTTYQPMQYLFPDGESFKHEELKWVDYDEMSIARVDDPALDARLRDVSARFFRALGGASFGRCDLRVDASGTPYMLEINPNCGVYFEEADYGGADFCLANDPAGHRGFTEQLVRAAQRRAEGGAGPAEVSGRPEAARS
jgi:D-alanine-D-alanine ligase